MGTTVFQSVDSLRLCCAARRPQFEAMASPFLAQRKKRAAYSGEGLASASIKDATS